MNMDDWLDSRLAEDAYLPDEGFTARVMQQLPSQPLLDERRRFLLFAPFIVIACALFGMGSLNALWRGQAELFRLGSQLRPAFRHSVSYLDSFSALAYWLEQPAVWLGCIGSFLLIAYLGSPSLRRWV